MEVGDRVCALGHGQDAGTENSLLAARTRRLQMRLQDLRDVPIEDRPILTSTLRAGDCSLSTRSQLN